MIVFLEVACGPGRTSLALDSTVLKGDIYLDTLCKVTNGAVHHYDHHGPCHYMYFCVFVTQFGMLRPEDLYLAGPQMGEISDEILSVKQITSYKRWGSS